MPSVSLSPYVIRQVITLAREMRAAQIEFFKTRSPAWQGQAMKLEQRFDRLLASIELPPDIPRLPTATLLASSSEEVREFVFAFPEYG